MGGCRCCGCRTGGRRGGLVEWLHTRTGAHRHSGRDDRALRGQRHCHAQRGVDRHRRIQNQRPAQRRRGGSAGAGCWRHARVCRAGSPRTGRRAATGGGGPCEHRDGGGGLSASGRRRHRGHGSGRIGPAFERARRPPVSRQLDDQRKRQQLRPALLRCRHPDGVGCHQSEQPRLC